MMWASRQGGPSVKGGTTTTGNTAGQWRSLGHKAPWGTQAGNGNAGAARKQTETVIMAKKREILGPDPENPQTHVLVLRPVKDGDKETEARYSMFSGWPTWADRIVALRQAEINGKWSEAEQTEAARYFNAYDYTLGVTESQRVREAAAADSTEITVDGVKKDLMVVPLAKLCRGINGILDAEATTGKEAPNAYRVARRKLLADGKARLAVASEPDGDIVPA